MANLNKVFLMGNLTRDPEITYMPSNQKPICKIGIATNRKWTGADGQPREEVTFVDCTAFDKTADLIGKFFKKGKPIFIEGRLKYEHWEAQDGTKRSKISVTIENFQFIDAGSRAPGEFQPEGDHAESRPAPSAPAPRQYAPRPQGRPQTMTAPAAPVVVHADADSQIHPSDDGPAPIGNDEIPF